MRLVRGLREVRRGAAAPAEQPVQRLPRGLRRVEKPGVRTPGGGPREPPPRVDRRRRAAHRRHPRIARREGRLRIARLLVIGAAAVGGGGVRTAVARGEVDRDALDCGELEEVVVLGDGRRGLVARRAVQRTAPRVGDDLGQVMGDQIGKRGQQVGVLARVGAVIEDVRGGRHRVHRLNIERLLGAPPRRPTARVLVVPRGRRHILGVLSGSEGGQAVRGRPRIRIGEHRRRVVRVENRHRRPASRMPLRAVRGPQLGRRVPAHRVRLVHAPEGRIRRISLLTVRRRARRRNQRPGRRRAPIPAVSVPTVLAAPQILRSRSRRHMLRIHGLGERTEPGNRRDITRHPAGTTGSRSGATAAAPAPAALHPLPPIRPQHHPVRPIHIPHAPRHLHVLVVRRGDPQPRLSQPGGHGLLLTRRRRIPSSSLSRAEKVPITSVPRRRNGSGVRRQPRGSAPARNTRVVTLVLGAGPPVASCGAAHPGRTPATVTTPPTPGEACATPAPAPSATAPTSTPAAPKPPPRSASSVAPTHDGSRPHPSPRLPSPSPSATSAPSEPSTSSSASIETFQFQFQFRAQFQA